MSNVVINPYNFGIPFPNTYSLDFDSVDDFVSMGDVLDFDYTDAFTFSAWIKYTHEVASNAIVCKMETSGDYRGYEFFVTSDHKLRILFYHTGSNRLDQRGGTILTTDTWYHVAVTYSGGGAFTDIKIYLNGAAETLTKLGNNNITGTSVNAIPFQIGARNSVWDFFNGNIDEVSVWNTELSSSDISTLYNSGTPNNLNTALATTPQSWWRMGDSGTFFNSNWEIPEQTKIDNWSSHSMEFDGVNDYVSMGNVLDKDGTEAFSISAWVKYTSGSSIAIVAKNDSGTPSGYSLFSQAVGGINWYPATSAGGYIQVKSSNGVNDGDWHHVLATYDGSGNASGAKIYIDGSLDTTIVTDTATGSSSNSTDLQIGARDGTGLPFYGSIDDVAIFNTDKSASASSIYNSGVPSDLSGESGLEGYWIFDDATFSTNWTIPDNSSNSNNGTSVNMAIDDKVNNAPDNINQGLTSGMVEGDRVEDTP